MAPPELGVPHRQGGEGGPGPGRGATTARLTSPAEKQAVRQVDAMLQFVLGFTLGNVVGMYLAQNYDIPNIAKKLEDFKKDVEAKKKPPSDKS